MKDGRGAEKPVQKLALSFLLPTEGAQQEGWGEEEDPFEKDGRESVFQHSSSASLLMSQPWTLLARWPDHITRKQTRQTASKQWRKTGSGNYLQGAVVSLSKLKCSQRRFKDDPVSCSDQTSGCRTVREPVFNVRQAVLQHFIRLTFHLRFKPSVQMNISLRHVHVF